MMVLVCGFGIVVLYVGKHGSFLRKGLSSRKGVVHFI